MINWTQLIQYSMKEGTKEITEIYRQMKKRELDFDARKNAKPLTEQAQFSMIRKEIKELNEEAEAFIKRGTNEHPTVPGNAIKIRAIEQYLPLTANEHETRAVVANAMNTTQAKSMKDMGKIVAFVKADAREFDMALVTSIAKQQLGANNK